MSTKPLTLMDKTILLRQLATLIHAGIPLIRCCDIVEKLPRNHRIARVMFFIKMELCAGKSFSQSIKAYLDYFDASTYHFIRIGEASGALDDMLLKLAELQESRWRWRNQLMQALYYPFFVCLMTGVILMGLMLFIIPRFADLYASNHTALPWITHFVFTISLGLRHLSLISIMCILALIPTIHFLQQLKLIEINSFSLLLKLPYIRRYYHKTTLTQFIYQLATTYTAGIPLLQGLEILYMEKLSLPIRSLIQLLIYRLKSGCSLHDALLSQPHIPPFLTHMVKIGEETGKLGDMLTKVATTFEQELQRTTQQITKLLEPLIILILGVLIGGLMISLYLPIFKLGNVF